MTPCIFIYYTPSYQPLADIVLPRVKAYAERHDYRLELFCEDWSVLPLGNYKMHMLYHILPKYSHVWVLDLDTLITNPDIPFMQFTDDEHDIFIATDVNGINAGSWIARNTEATRDFIRLVINNFDAPEEQTVMKRYINDLKVKYLEHPCINSYKYSLYGTSYPYGEWEPGHLLLHLPGLSLEQRVEILGGMV